MMKPYWLFFILILFYSSVFAHNLSYNSVEKTNSFGFVQEEINDTTVIRFDYKQSALFHTYTFESIDSVVDILLKNKAVTITIDGFAYKDEGSDTICYYLSLNRALFVQTYVLGRGIDSSRILKLNAWGNKRQLYTAKDKEGLTVNCRAEILMNYPPVKKKLVVMDKDEDGIVDSEDKCPDVFGISDNNGCPNSDMVIVPFAREESTLYMMTYRVLDSVVAVLKDNPAYSITIGGHAHISEGINEVCDRLATERADIVKQYLLSRQLNISRISSVKNHSNHQPLNAGKNPIDILANSRAEIVFLKD